MFGIIDENKKFILCDTDYNRLRITALMLSEKKDDVFVMMFDENTVDEVVKEYNESEIETAYNGEKYLKGFAPIPDNKYQSEQREKAYISEIDPITSHIQRLRDKEQTEEIIAEIDNLMIEREEKFLKIQEQFPYFTQKQ